MSAVGRGQKASHARFCQSAVSHSYRIMVGRINACLRRAPGVVYRSEVVCHGDILVLLACTSVLRGCMSPIWRMLLAYISLSQLQLVPCPFMHVRFMPHVEPRAARYIYLMHTCRLHPRTPHASCTILIRKANLEGKLDSSFCRDNHCLFLNNHLLSGLAG